MSGTAEGAPKTAAQHRMRGAYHGIKLGRALAEVDDCSHRLFSAHSHWDASDLLKALRAAVREAERLRRAVEDDVR